MTELTIVETGEVVETMTHVEAERITARIADKLDAIADNVEQVLPLIGEALTREAWKALGYTSPTAYVSDRFTGALTRLPVEVRRSVVTELSASGMSTRAIAPVVGASHMTVARDLETPVTPVTPTPGSPARSFTDNPGKVQQITGPATKDWGLPKSDKIIGGDGKTYTRPEPAEASKPTRPALPDQILRAVRELTQVTERLERLVNDDRFSAHKKNVAYMHVSDIQRSAGVLSDVLHKITD